MTKRKPDLTKIKMILMDLDGCLSTGQIIYTGTGDDIKIFHTHDGYGIVRAQKLGIKFAVISGMTSPVNKRRINKLKIEHLLKMLKTNLSHLNI